MAKQVNLAKNYSIHGAAMLAMINILAKEEALSWLG
jgi:hypothetical protein